MNTPDLRGEHARELQGHRHHADGPQLRSRACRAACTCTSGKGKMLKKVHSPTDAQPRRPGAEPTAGRTHAATTGRPDDRASCSTSCRPRADPADPTTGPRSSSGWSPSSTARAWRVSWSSCASDAPGPARRAGRRRAGRRACSSSTACTPTTWPRRVGGGARVGAPVPRGPRRRRRAARHRRRRRRGPPAPARAAATAARRRRSRCAPRSSGPSSRPRPRSSSSTSRSRHSGRPAGHQAVGTPIELGRKPAAVAAFDPATGCAAPASARSASIERATRPGAR